LAGKRYRKGDLILLKNTDFEKSHPDNSLNYFLLLRFNYPERYLI